MRSPTLFYHGRRFHRCVVSTRSRGAKGDIDFPEHRIVKILNVAQSLG